MTLGTMNPAKFDPKTVVTLPNVDTVGFWEAEIDDVKLNGKGMGWRNRTAILDTGTVNFFLLIDVGIESTDTYV
jgi:hypothetical protein